MKDAQPTGGLLWEPLFSLALTDERMDFPWHVAHEYLVGPKILKLTATGNWDLFGGIACGPDGVPGLPLPADRLLAAKVSIGCLIGRLGGSNASIDENTVSPFAIGSFAIVQVPDKFVGPVFIAVNVDRTQAGQQVKKLVLNALVSESPFPAST